MLNSSAFCLEQSPLSLGNHGDESCLWSGAKRLLSYGAGLDSVWGLLRNSISKLLAPVWLFLCLGCTLTSTCFCTYDFENLIDKLKLPSATFNGSRSLEESLSIRNTPGPIVETWEQEQPSNSVQFSSEHVFLGFRPDIYLSNGWELAQPSNLVQFSTKYVFVGFRPDVYLSKRRYLSMKNMGTSTTFKLGPVLRLSMSFWGFDRMFISINGGICPFPV